jgi:hypothetical protein
VSGLVEFLRARLDEEKAEAARLADVDDYPLDPWSLQWEETGEWNSYAYLRISKARVLAEGEAKRRLINEYERVNARAQYPDSEGGMADGLELAVHLLALPYAQHPDYREEWKP